MPKKTSYNVAFKLKDVLKKAPIEEWRGILVSMNAG